VAFPPGFVIAHATPDGPRVETVPLGPIPLDPALMALYRTEGGEAPEMLAAPDYPRFLLAQTRRRARNRDLPRDWPAAITAALPKASALDLASLMEGAPSLAADPARAATAERRATEAGLPPGSLAAYPLTDLAADWYVLREAGPLARAALAPERLAVCRHLATTYGDPAPGRTDDAAFFARLLAALATSLARMDRGDPTT
jgi:hypothetical protein